MNMKKILCGAVALSLSLTMFAGCGKKNASTSMKMEPGEGSKITKEVFEPTLLLLDYDYEKMHVFQEAFKYTNVKPKAFVATTADANQHFEMMLAGGEKMADIAGASVSRINSAAVEGAFIDLLPLIEEHAPNIKAYFEEFPEYKAQCLASDGKLYVIPTTYDSSASEGFFIRKDWLDKLGLEVPTTVDEYHDALLAFKTQDPNGNGKADEIPYFYRNQTWYGLVQLFGAYHRDYIDDNGKFHRGFFEPEFKVAMENLIQWNKEGLIDPEWETRTNAREELLGNNLGGATHDWFSSTGSFTKNVRENHAGEAWAEKFDFAPIAPPADINGEVKEIYSRPKMRGIGWGISSTNEYPVETIKYFDWWFTEQGKLTYWYGMEGTDYVKEADGTIKFTDLVLDYTKGVPLYMRENGQIDQGAPMSMEAEMAGMTEAAKEGFAMYEREIKIIPQVPTLSFTPEERDELDTIQADLNTHVDETIDKWFAGTLEFNDAAWDAYIAKCEELGSKRLVEINQAAFDRLVAAGGGLDDTTANVTNKNN